MSHQGISCHTEAVAIVEMSGLNLTQNLMFTCTDVIVPSAIRVGYLYLIIAPSALNLIASWDELSVYTCNTGFAEHYPCKTLRCKTVLSSPFEPRWL